MKIVINGQRFKFLSFLLRFADFSCTTELYFLNWELYTDIIYKNMHCLLALNMGVLSPIHLCITWHCNGFFLLLYSLTVESTRATGGKYSHQGNDPDRGKSTPRSGSFTLLRTQEFNKIKMRKKRSKIGVF